MAKRPRTEGPKPEDLFTGAVVLYGEGQRGVITDAFAPLNQFWVADEESGELIRGDDGNAHPFAAADLQLAPVASRPQDTGSARVLLIGAESHMLQILEHFGAPDATERRDPQQLLAVPCASCRCGTSCARFDPGKRCMCNKEECPLLQLAVEGIDEAMLTLARRLRPDIFTDVRAFHLKQAVEQIGPDLRRLEGYYCLSAVTLPFGKQEIGKSEGWERYWMEEVRCQVDLGVSAEGGREQGEASLEDTARRALGEACGLCLSDHLWSEEAQFKVRRQLGVDIPLKFWDGSETKVFVIILPETATCAQEKDLLMIREAGGGASEAEAASKDGAASGKKTIAQWKEDQEQFKDLPKLPEGWIRIKSSSHGGEIYFWDTKNNRGSSEFPLPEGWTKQKSKTTGKEYYFNAKKRKSQFDPPTQ